MKLFSLNSTLFSESSDAVVSNDDDGDYDDYDYDDDDADNDFD